MKKTLVTLLALVFVLGIAATAFAAPANPFVDVPAKHWAYGAVSKLVKAGVVDGYGDGTFRGDKTMTRYEMAQIVAKAMARSEKADAQQKALIDKLAVEFAAELNNLGVRVAKLEANQSNIKLTGNAAFRYTTKKADAGPGSSKAEYRLRVDAVAKVDDKTSAGFRFVTNPITRNDVGNLTWQTFGENGQSQVTNGNNIDRIYFTTKLGDVATTLGRQALVIDTQGVFMDSGAFSYDGLKFAWKTGDFNFGVQYGRFLKGATLNGLAAGNITYDGATVQANQLYGDLDITSLNISSKAGKFDYGVGYVNGKNPVKAVTPVKWLLIDTKYTFDKKWALQTEYLRNSATEVNVGKGKTALAAKLTFGDFVINKKGASNLFLQYVDRKANSFAYNFSSLDTNPGTANSDYNAKIWGLGLNYGFSKTWTGYLGYFWTKPEAGTPGTGTVKQLRAVTTVVF